MKPERAKKLLQRLEALAEHPATPKEEAVAAKKALEKARQAVKKSDAYLVQIEEKEMISAVSSYLVKAVKAAGWRFYRTVEGRFIAKSSNGRRAEAATMPEVLIAAFNWG